MMPTGTNPTWVYNSAGSLYCTTLGCQYHRFTNSSGGAKLFQISTCVQ
jgi:hypothetical protein